MMSRVCVWHAFLFICSCPVEPLDLSLPRVVVTSDGKLNLVLVCTGVLVSPSSPAEHSFSGRTSDVGCGAQLMADPLCIRIQSLKYSTLHSDLVTAQRILVTACKGRPAPCMSLAWHAGFLMQSKPCCINCMSDQHLLLWSLPSPLHQIAIKIAHQISSAGCIY